MKYHFILLLFVLECVISVPPPNVNGTNLNCYRSYRIRSRSARDRPGSGRTVPLAEERVSYNNIGVSRHHIIPYLTLRDFYNRLIQNREHFQRLLENVLEVAARNAGLILNSVEHIQLLRNQPLGDLPAVLRSHVNTYNQNRQVRIAQEVYIWMQFNIFLGPNPTSRTDDTRSNTFENNADIIIGQLRHEQLRRMYVDIQQYLAGTITDPTSIIDSMGDLIRITPEPYQFNTDQWRIRIFDNRYAIATAAITSNRNYRRLLYEDYCREDNIAAFFRYNPPEFQLLDFEPSYRHRRDIQNGCLPEDKGAKYDLYCIKSLDKLCELINNNVLSIKGTEIEIVKPNEGATPSEPTKSSDCNPALAAAGGAVTGGLSATGVCLLMGGAYVPVVGWTTCAIGGLIYGAGGAVVGSTVSLATC